MSHCSYHTDMRICLAQTKSIKGKLTVNLDHHLEIIENARGLNLDLIIFPELSLTGYEPTMVHKTALKMEDPIMNPFQKIANSNAINIAIGVPLKSESGTTISAIIFQPHKARLLYSKRLLHDDELPFFIPGQQQPQLTFEDYKIAFGICYETLHREHFEAAFKKHPDCFIASVSKPEKNLNEAFIHFSKMAKAFSTPILMVNSIGPSDNFISKGQSAVWNSKGELLNKLNSYQEGLLVFDSHLNLASKHNIG